MMGEDQDAESQVPLYIRLLRQIADTEEYTLDVDCDHLYKFSPHLYKQLEDYPTDVIPIFDLIAVQVFRLYVTNANNPYGDVGGENSNLQEQHQEND